MRKRLLFFLLDLLDRFKTERSMASYGIVWVHSVPGLDVVLVVVEQVCQEVTGHPIGIRLPIEERFLAEAEPPAIRFM